MTDESVLSQNRVTSFMDAPMGKMVDPLNLTNQRRIKLLLLYEYLVSTDDGQKNKGVSRKCNADNIYIDCSTQNTCNMVYI